MIAARLAEALRQRAAGRRRLELADVWAAFGEVVPSLLGTPEARPRLAELLTLLEAEAIVRLPQGRAHHDRSATPHLPLWIRLAPGAAPPATRRDHRAVAWPPELAFVASLPSLVNLDAALAIKAFLGAGGRERPLVPSRERSVELFGDEKRLDRLRGSQLFGPGRLTLEILRCFEVPPPLTWEPGPPGAPRCLLVLENLHTYDSFRRWNATSAAYAGVAYGQGNQFLRSAADLPRLARELALDHVAYFGDLDRRGLSIAAAAAAMLRPFLALVPADRFYRLLLDRAEAYLAGRASARELILGEEEVDWLPVDLREPTRNILARGLRLPQELVGWELLRGGAPGA